MDAVDRPDRLSSTFVALTRRYGVRTKVTVAMCLFGVLLAPLIYQMLSASSERRLDAEIDRRADDLAIAFATGEVDGSESVVVAVVAAQPEVDALALVSPTDSTVIASNDARSVGEVPSSAINPELRVVVDAVLAGTVDGTVTSSGEFQIRDIPTESSDSGNETPTILVVGFDRDAVGADLAFAGQQTGVALVAAVGALLALVYLLLGRIVTRPARKLIDRMRAGQPELCSVNVPHDELAAFESLALNLLSIPTRGASEQPAADSRLPAMWLELDRDLRVIESSVESGASDGEEPPTLDVSELSDLLSDSVVSYVRQLVDTLNQGQAEAFEFTVGATTYLAELARTTDEHFEIAIVESVAEVVPLSVAEQGEAVDVLGSFLSILPITVLELDAAGSVQFINRSYLGRERDELLGRSLIDILPRESAEEGRDAMRSAMASNDPQRFDVRIEAGGRNRVWSHELVRYGPEDSQGLLVAAVEIPVQRDAVIAGDTVSGLEEQLWAAELKIAELETHLEMLGESHVLLEDGTVQQESSQDDVGARLLGPARAVVRAGIAIAPDNLPAGSRAQVEVIHLAIVELASAFDEEFGTSLTGSLKAAEMIDERFHLATFLDEIAIEMSRHVNRHGSRISVLVQPSLPKWLRGNIGSTRAAIYQMLEIARMVASDRPLILAALQDTSTGRQVQVRFEVQIPPPMLDADALSIVRGCISGEYDALSSSEALADLVGDPALPDFNPLDVELVTVDERTTVMRCSAGFEIGEERETDHSWVRGLRTLIIQDASQTDNGIQASLAAFGTIGYVVNDEESLIGALKIAEEYSNPYRFVLADVETPDLESFVGQLFDGDAPVVLVGAPSESAMVGALSVGYDGYIAKPVRQVDLLEVILSTVEPPATRDGSESRADAA